MAPWGHRGSSSDGGTNAEACLHMMSYVDKDHDLRKARRGLKAKPNHGKVSKIRLNIFRKERTCGEVQAEAG